MTISENNPRDIRVREVETSYENYLYRTPLKFGGKVGYAATFLNTRVTVESRDGKQALGEGSMSMGATWSFPSDTLSTEEKLDAMKALAERIRSILEGHGAYGHPVEIACDLEKEYMKAAGEVSQAFALADPVPALCTLVTASPFDAAVHDAYGKLHGLNVYNAYSAEYMNRDISAYLSDEFSGEYLDRYTLRQPRERMPLYHLVGALDPITNHDVKERIDDGLPNTLGEWIEYDGLTHLKIKLNGEDLAWDINRVLCIDDAAAEAQRKRGVSTWFYSADFNEKCPHVAYLVDFLNKIRETRPACFERIQYIEQPTSRYLEQHMENRMHEAAKIKPVVIDEALVDFEHLRLSMELGYSGVALKTCKGQSQALLMGAAAIKYKLFLCVQDLTLVGASFLHSAGLCARIPGVAAIEGNGRQYCPAANKGWEDRFPSIFKVENGTLGTSVLTKPGLGH